MGIVPRAESDNASESDEDSAILPTILLGSDSFTVSSLQAGNVHTSPGVLSKVHQQDWGNWLTDEVPAITDQNLSLFELTIQSKLSVQNFHANVSALIDTGCRIPLLIRTGLIPPRYLVRASRSIKILTADNSPMIGGTHGCKVELILPVFFNAGTPPKQLRCPPLWAYECQLIGSDLIIGYPFLKFNSLVVDCPSDTLRHTTLTRSSREALLHTSPTTLPHTSHTDKVVAKSDPPDPVQPEEESKLPAYSPGSKVKEPSAQDIRPPSSYLAAPLHRPISASPLSGFAAHIHQVVGSQQPLPSDPLSGPLVALPCHSSLDQGDSACSSLFETPNTHFKCSQCERITTQPDYDCGCIISGPDLLPMLESETDSIQVNTMTGHINQNCLLGRELNQNFDDYVYKNEESPKYDLSWWDKLHHKPENFILGAEKLDSIWFQVLPETPLVSPAIDSLSGRQGQTGLASGLQDQTISCLSGLQDQTTSCLSGSQDQTIFCVVRRMTSLTSELKRVKNAFRTGNYRICQPLFENILNWAADRDIIPVVDAFSSKAHARLPDYWSSHSDAFNKTWSNKVLWMNPPLHHLSRIIEKIMNDEARGVIIVPVRPRADWFIGLLYIAVDWFDLPPGDNIFEDPFEHSLHLTESFPFRVILFDALRIRSSLPAKPYSGFGRDPYVLSALHSVLTETGHDAEQQHLVRSAIESASPHLGLKRSRLNSGRNSMM